LLIGSSLVDRLIDAFGAAPVLATVPAAAGQGRPRPIPGGQDAQRAKGARGLIAARKGILELPAGPRLSSTSIHGESAPASRRSIDMRLSGNAGEIFSGTRLA